MPLEFPHPGHRGVTLASSPAESPPAIGAPGVLPPTIEAARTFCRAMLPRVSRTFALNIRLLSGSMGEAVRIGYLLCRIADTIEDAWPGDRREVERRFDQFAGALGGSAADAEAFTAGAAELSGRANASHVELVAGTRAVLRSHAELAPEDRADVAEAVRILAAGMRRYAGRAAERAATESGRAGVLPRAGTAATGGGAAPGPRVATFAYLDDDAELTDYCWIVAGCVGVMLTRLFGRRVPATPHDAARLALSPAVGEGLQLTNILLDWPADVRSGRCHLPATWLAEFGVSPRDLVGVARPEVEALALRLESRAHAALNRVPDYLATIPARHVRYRMFCLWPALWAAASLRHARRDPGFPWAPERPRLPKGELWRMAGAALVQGHTADGVAALVGGATGGR